MKKLSGRRVLITAGPTREYLDPVRFLTNASSGRMGFALAEEARRRGAEVVLIAGPVALETPKGVKRVDVATAEEMCRAALRHGPKADLLIAAAAVGDWRFEKRFSGKIKRKASALTVRLVPNKDIVLELARRRRPGQLIVGFALETGRWLERARAKLRRKGLDLIVANTAEALAASRSRAAVLSRAGGSRLLPTSSKRVQAGRILDEVIRYSEYARRDRKAGGGA